MQVTPVKRILVSEGRRQSWLAREVGIDQSDMSRIVNRGLIPDEPIQDAIAKALRRTVEELWPSAPHQSTDRRKAA